MAMAPHQAFTWRSIGKVLSFEKKCLRDCLGRGEVGAEGLLRGRAGGSARKIYNKKRLELIDHRNKGGVRRRGIEGNKYAIQVNRDRERTRQIAPQER